MISLDKQFAYILFCSTINGNSQATGISEQPRQYWYTAPTIGPDNIFTGNRILPSESKGGFPHNVDYFDIEFPSTIKWLVVSNPMGGLGPQFVVTTEDGLAFVVRGGTTTTSEVLLGKRNHVVVQLDYPTISEVNPDQPPLVITHHDGIDNVTKTMELPSSAKISPLSHPVPIFSCGKNQSIITSKPDKSCNHEIYVYINTENNIVLFDLETDMKLDQIANINALPDGRIVMAPTNVFDTDEDDDEKSILLAVYGGATPYSHCVLGDCLEGSSLILIRVLINGDASCSMTLKRQTALPSGTIFEGLSPMFIEGGATMITTVSNSTNGAWLRTYDILSGNSMSESPHIGWGWRHLLFYNRFAPIEKNINPLYSAVDILTPHVMKELEFFDISSNVNTTTLSSGGFDGIDKMELRDSKSKYTTHDIGWRYLDTAFSGDLNGDGMNEAIVMDEDLQNLVSLQLVHDDDSGFILQEVWSIPLAGKLTSNVAVVPFYDVTHSGVALAAASGMILRVWTSQSLNDGKIEDNNVSGASRGESYASNDGFEISLLTESHIDTNKGPKRATGFGLFLASLFLVFPIIC